MNQFQGAKYFTFDGVDSRSKNLMLVQVGDKSEDPIFGIKRNLNMSNESGRVVVYGINEECPEINFQITKVQGYNLEPFSDKEIKEISRWLFSKKKVGILQVNGFIYYGIFSESTDFLTDASQGYLNVKFQMATTCAYTPIVYKHMFVSGEKEFELENRSTATEIIYPDFQFKLNGDVTDITITNLNLGDSLVFKNLNKGEVIDISSGDKPFMKSLITGEQVLTLSNRVYPRMKYGINRFKITTNSSDFVELNIFYQEQMCLY